MKIPGKASILTLLLASCGSPPAPAHGPSVASVAAAPSAALAPPLLGLYLPRDRANGSPYCLDPDSPALRARVHGPRRQDTDVLSAPALAEDIRELHTAMKKLYAGYPELLQNPQFDVERFFAEWEADVRKAGATITLRDGVLTPFVRLRRAQHDNHLSVSGFHADRYPEFTMSEYQTKGEFPSIDPARCSFGGASPRPGTLRVSRVLSRGDVAAITTFSAQSTADTVDVRCVDATTTFTRRPPSRMETDRDAPSYEWHTTGDAAVVVVRRLSGSPRDLETLTQLAKDYDAHRKKPVIVFDLRRNGGGSDEYVYDWIKRAVRGPWPATYASLFDNAGRWPCGDWNYLVLPQIAYGRVDQVDARRERDAYWKALPSSFPAQEFDARPELGGATTPYAGRVFVLVDRFSASSGETAPEALRLALGATVVGERSTGVLEFGDIRPWLMPRTGITWGLASKRHYFESPREDVGLPVDVYLGEDLIDVPADALVPLLAKLPRAK